LVVDPAADTPSSQSTSALHVTSAGGSTLVGAGAAAHVAAVSQVSVDGQHESPALHVSPATSGARAHGEPSGRNGKNAPGHSKRGPHVGPLKPLSER
jgi:hypothetical protein